MAIILISSWVPKDCQIVEGAEWRYFRGYNNYSRFNAKKPHPPQNTSAWEFLPVLIASCMLQIAYNLQLVA